MPRRAAASIRPIEPDPVHRSKLVQQVINRVMLDGKKSTAERIVYDALAIIAERTRQGPDRGARGLDQGAHAGARGPVPPRRRRDLPGARRGAGAPRPHARRALARRVRPPAPREDDGAAARERAGRRAVPAGRLRTSARTTSTAWRRPTRPSRTTAGSASPRLAAPWSARVAALRRLPSPASAWRNTRAAAGLRSAPSATPLAASGECGEPRRSPTVEVPAMETSTR